MSDDRFVDVGSATGELGGETEDEADGGGERSWDAVTTSCSHISILCALEVVMGLNT